MCLICKDLIIGKLTSNEALANLKETIDSISDIHFMEVLEVIYEKQQEEKE